MKTVKISALSAAILLSGFASSAAWSAASETVIIGLAGPLTGPSARIGKDLENGAQLAIDDINKQHPTIGGKAVTFKLQSEDDQSDPPPSPSPSVWWIAASRASSATGTPAPAFPLRGFTTMRASPRSRRSPPGTPTPNRVSTPASA